MTSQNQDRKNKSTKPLLLLVGVALGAFAILLFQKINNKTQIEVVPTPLPSPVTVLASTQPSATPSQIIPTPKPSALPKPTSTPGSTVNYEQLKNVKFTLPDGWTSIIETKPLSSVKGLFISAPGGYINILANNYPGNIGRREFFCQIVIFDGCSKMEFATADFGNISGYVRTNESQKWYFGVKGNFFYTVLVANTAGAGTEFEQNYQKVLNSLVF